MAGIAFYKALRRPIIVRIVTWYGGSINRASGQYAELLAEAAAHHSGFGSEQRQAIEEEVQEFARKKIGQRVARVWLGLFCGNRSEPNFTKMVTKVMAELADHESNLISQARAALNRAAVIYAEKRGMRRYSEQRLRRVQSNREKVVREIAWLGYKGLSYCRELDTRKISGNPEWLRNKDWPGKYEAAYKQNKKWQKRIQQEKWRICARRRVSVGNH